MADHRLDRAIEALARTQHGAFSIRQVHELGGDRHAAKRRVANGSWLRLDRGVYALPGNPPTPLRQMKAAELAVAGSFVSGTSGAFLHRVPDCRLGRIELSAPRNAGHTALATVRHRVALPVTRVEGIRVTTLAQTLADIAHKVPATTLQDGVDWALLHQKTTWGELEAAWARSRSHRTPGWRRLGQVLLERDPALVLPASVLEARLYRQLDDPRLPPYVRQAPAPWAPSSGQRVDALFPSFLHVVEADGRSFHARVADFERDRERDQAALRAGVTVTRFTASQIDTPGYVVAHLLQVFEQLRHPDSRGRGVA